MVSELENEISELKIGDSVDISDIQKQSRMDRLKPWISITERLPLYKECILLYNKECGVSFGCYKGENDNGMLWFIEYTGFEFIPTHWMSLPESPRD